MYSQLRDAPPAPGDYSASLHLAAPHAHHSHHQQPIIAEEAKPGSFGLRRPYLNNLPSLHLLNPPMSPPGPSSSASSATSAGSATNNLLTPPTYESATSSTAPEAYSIAPSSSFPNNSSMSYWAAASSARYVAEPWRVASADVVFVYVVTILAAVVVIDRVVTLCNVVICRCSCWQQFSRSILPNNRDIVVPLFGVDFFHPLPIRLPTIVPPVITAPATTVLLGRLSAMAISSTDESAARNRATTIAYVASLV
ncbi:uncharacterized protein V1513DRAFT_459782 [Lipomyces chichibuensis]|uniref:uncharacterized protein n=1 Tax=Lipomyces chichibuensis TaxID=1546026 RepID=UPI003343B0B4